MSPPEDTPPSRWQWLDWWFALRWRALLTWVLLTAFSGVMGQTGFQLKIGSAIDWVFAQLRQISGGGWPSPSREMVFLTNLVLMHIWFEPLALRLTFARGVSWICLRIAPKLLFVFALPPGEGWRLALTPAGYALLIPILYGWRSRPWICAVAGVLAEAVSIGLGRNSVEREWVLAVGWTLPFAATLLYGTRLLTPEERAQREA